MRPALKRRANEYRERKKRHTEETDKDEAKWRVIKGVYDSDALPKR